MPSPSHRTRDVLAITPLVLALTLLTAPRATASAPRPDFQLPFGCGETWYGSSRASHTPSPLAVDWNRDESDLGHVVVAAQTGVVSSVVDLGGSSYGLYVVIDHNGAWSTLYAHLEASFVVAGQRVDEGQPIALLGDSGNTTGPHLHFEQRKRDEDKREVFDGTPFTYNTWLQSRDCPDVPLVGDWSGNGHSEVGAFGRRPGAGVFRERFASGLHNRLPFGLPTDQPVVGDWNGDSTTDLGIWRTTKRLFVLRSADGARESFHFGSRGDIAVVGDWNGNGTTDVGLFRPATATFRLLGDRGHVTTTTFGTASSIPIAGDWDGDGRWNVGVYDPSTSTFSLAMPDGATRTLVFGTPYSIPVVGSWNKDDRTDIGAWDPATAVFSKRLGAHKTTVVRFGHPR